MSDRYAKSVFSIAIGFLAGPESLCVRVSKAWTEVSSLEATHKFEDEEMQEDFDWLMSKMEQFAVGDRQRPRAADGECEQVRQRLVKMYNRMGGT